MNATRRLCTCSHQYREKKGATEFQHFACINRLKIFLSVLLFLLLLNAQTNRSNQTEKSQPSHASRRNLSAFIVNLKRCFTKDSSAEEETPTKVKQKTKDKEPKNIPANSTPLKKDLKTEIWDTIDALGPCMTQEEMIQLYFDIHDYLRRKFQIMVDELWVFTLSFAKEKNLREEYRSKYWWQCSDILTSNLMKMHANDLDDFANFLKKESNSNDEFKKYMADKINRWQNFTSEKKKMWMTILRNQLKKY
ncbi:hypothetical protein PCYB_101040 [Plasmodium cynomolgi strain B]|uniref:Plasmodium RESA N-terminal domain-containing protein n=1 Tax=Plasmodium cynomolgi (strain B) TaxID=1120755 RepID=K6UIC1_PLACD|nr:hypothetical protein PCYB_032940 [Plasmodium cynomolgi strain B]XP_004222701.1 hypothetical protein PCYB_101040 [Plasmodium cynomolgi strain B]GAB64883.1 hypothetical protein PCYB_032940 [Plasmodium cynomolgi strain B]GAB66754.1 hypothetical protein PCYB_101040 [Plasmodium cynomolgi strain B]